ncbi:MAG: right-handed parallel beta-helix repeat-containing protein [Desulfuromonadaceae bacterium]|nr:right-handed parallel beta-helix repeat-containing protein [Desulfuromonadaceae bacterium]
MKTLFAAFIFFCMTTISMAAEQPAVVYDGVVLTEDVTWSGSILVQGFVLVAPNVTLRIDPGTVVRFAAAADGQLPGLVIQGRIHAAGTSEQPIAFTSDQSSPLRGSWGGIVLLSTGKHNLMEHCRIEYAETGIDLRFSTVALQSVSIVQARTALLLHDGVVQMTGSTVSDSETGIEGYNSEFDVRDTTITSCKRGCFLNKSAVVLAAVNIMNNQETGLEAKDCRIRITGGEFSGNMHGGCINGGEGQIVMSKFMRNRQTALHLGCSRIKIQRCLFVDNVQDALRVEDGLALFLNNVFSSNGRYNLYNAGSEIVSARLNWWGSADRSLIWQKIHDILRDKDAGAVHAFPWLVEKPRLMP